MKDLDNQPCREAEDMIQELDKAIEDTKAKAMGDMNFSIGWIKSFRDTLVALTQINENVAMIPIGRTRMKDDFGGYTGYTHNVKKVGNNIVVDVGYEYPEGPLYQPPHRMSFLLPCVESRTPPISYEAAVEKVQDRRKPLKIALTKGQFAIVDPADYENLNQWKWNASKSDDTYYATRSVNINGKRVNLAMHRVILKAPPGKMVDHKNHNGLDNRKANLRLASHADNNRNKRSQINNTSGFKGVSFTAGRWGANITIGNHPYFLGRFYNPEEAARAYDAKAIEVFGEFACTNVKLGLLPALAAMGISEGK